MNNFAEAVKNPTGRFFEKTHKPNLFAENIHKKVDKLSDNIIENNDTLLSRIDTLEKNQIFISESNSRQLETIESLSKDINSLSDIVNNFSNKVQPDLLLGQFDLLRNHISSQISSLTEKLSVTLDKINIVCDSIEVVPETPLEEEKNQETPQKLSQGKSDSDNLSVDNQSFKDDILLSD